MPWHASGMVRQPRLDTVCKDGQDMFDLHKSSEDGGGADAELNAFNRMIRMLICKKKAP